MIRSRIHPNALLGPNGAAVIVQRTSRKKTVGIIIEHGTVRVRAPKQLANWRIQALINSRADWIRDELRLQVTRLQAAPCSFTNNEPIVYLGTTYRLNLVPSRNLTIRIEDDVVIAPSVPDQRALMANWYREQAELVLQEITTVLATNMGVAPRSVSIREYRSQWGSCNSRGDIRFNARLILAPLSVLKYVVVHELAHLTHLNHSAKFWALVGTQIPDYRKRRKWLREHGSSLKI